LETKLTRISDLAKRRPRVKLQTLIHAIDEEALKVCHENLEKNKATGIEDDNFSHTRFLAFSVSVFAAPTVNLG